MHILQQQSQRLSHSVTKFVRRGPERCLLSGLCWLELVTTVKVRVKVKVSMRFLPRDGVVVRDLIGG